MERKVFTHIIGENAHEMNDLLAHNGFRRSQTIAYRPACENCRACVSVRVLVDEFKSTESLRRIMKANQDLVAEIKPPKATSEQFGLFSAYMKTRHAEGGMAEMSERDYKLMIEETYVTTTVVEYYQRGSNTWLTGKGVGDLKAMILMDELSDGLSLVYSFYNPNESEKRSLGTFMILDALHQCKKKGYPYLYLGYWVENSPKMAYKSRFSPQEHLKNEGWKRA